MAMAAGGVSERRALASVVLATVVGCVAAASAAARTPPVPRWLMNDETQFLTRVLARAEPSHVYYLEYPKKVAVVFEFSRVVICGGCSAPSNAMLPRGKMIRVTFDRRTHIARAADGIRFCEVKGAYAPASECLRR